MALYELIGFSHKQIFQKKIIYVDFFLYIFKKKKFLHIFAKK